MHLISQLALLIGIFSFILLLAGLVRPWMLLWWEDVQTRRKVIKLYGTIGAVSLLIYCVLILIDHL